MATYMDPDSEVIFKEKKEEKEEGTPEDATIRFDFPAAIPPERGMEGRTREGEEHRWVEPKKFSLRLENYNGKVDFKG